MFYVVIAANYGEEKYIYYYYYAAVRTGRNTGQTVYPRLPVRLIARASNSKTNSKNAQGQKMTFITTEVTGMPNYFQLKRNG